MNSKLAFLFILVECHILPDVDDFFLLIRGLFLIFYLTFYRAAFCRGLASVYQVKLGLCVYFAVIGPACQISQESCKKSLFQL